MRYAVLLRGVNVGGKHRVPKREFADALGQLGCTDVVVYLNSGNAVVTSSKKLEQPVVQTALETHFGFGIPTLVIPGEDVKRIAAAIPDDCTNDAPTPDKTGKKSDVLYLFPAVDTPDICDKLGYRFEIEMMQHVPGAVLTTISRKNQQRGSLHALVGTKLYTHMTLRNVNTARKLAELI